MLHEINHAYVSIVCKSFLIESFKFKIPANKCLISKVKFVLENISQVCITCYYNINET